jgi:serine/threonine protein kinase
MAPLSGSGMPEGSSSFDAISKIVEKLSASAHAALLLRYRPGRSLMDDYDVTDDVLGTGLNGGVMLASRRGYPSQRVAVKRLCMATACDRKRTAIYSEVAVQLSMDHPHIARLFDVYESSDCFELAMECLEGGELFCHIQQLNRLPEAAIAGLTRQLLGAVRYMHQRDVLHRDLKLENIMFTAYDRHNLKIIDFGLSKIRRKKENKLVTDCGTLPYTAPEVVLKRSYTDQCDIWSLGVIVFVMLSGQMPFRGSDAELVSAITSGRYAMQAGQWGAISHEARSLVSGMLSVDPRTRLTAKQALQHPWIACCCADLVVPRLPAIVQAVAAHGTGDLRRCLPARSPRCDTSPDATSCAASESSCFWSPLYSDDEPDLMVFSKDVFSGSAQSSRDDLGHRPAECSIM